MAVAELGYVIDKEGNITKATKNLKGLDVAAGGVEKSTNKMTTALGGAVGRMIALAAAAVSFAKITSTLANFDASISKLGAITRATTDDLTRMRDIAKDLGSTTEFSATQAADGLTFLGMAGFTAAESMAAIPAVLDLATASGLGLANAADQASNIMSGFGISAGNAAQVADVLAAASSRANTDVGQLGSAMSTVAPISKALGIDLANTAAAIGVLSDAGIQGERAGTALRGVMASLAGPTKQATDALSKYGLAAKDVNPETKSLADIFELLGSKGLTTADAMTIFGREAASAALVLQGASGRLREFGDELGNVDGEAKRMAETMRDNLGGDMQGLVSATEGLIIAMGDAGLTAAIRAVVQAITDSVRVFSGLLENIEAVQGVIISASSALFLYLMPAIGATTVSVLSLVTSLAFLKGALIATGIGAVIVLVGLVIGQFLKLAEATGGTGNAISHMGEVLNLTFQGAKTVVAAFVESWRGFTSSMQAIWLRFMAVVQGAWVDFLSTMAAALQHIPKMEAAFNAVAGAALEADAKASALEVSISRAEDAAASFGKNAASMLSGAFDGALAKAAQLVAIVRNMSTAQSTGPDDGSRGGQVPFIPAIPVVPIVDPTGGGGSGGGGGGGSSDTASRIQALVDSLLTERETLDAWYLESQEILASANAAELAELGGQNEAKLRLEQEYQERLNGLRDGYNGAALDQTQQFFGDMASALAGGNAKLAAIGQAFASVEALINAYRAFNQVLADPSLPWFAKIPAAAGVLAAGLKTVQSIKSMSGGGSSGGGSGGGSTATPSAAPSTPTAQQRAIIQVQGGRSRFTIEEINDIIASIQQESRDGVIIEGFNLA